MARRLRQVVDLYNAGKVVELKDGTPVWVQPLNPFEQDTARSEAHIARARITLAIREEGSDEVAKVRMWFDEDGREAAKDRLVVSHVARSTNKIYEAIRNDSEWAERLQIIDRGVEETALPLEEAETKLIAKIVNEFSAELGTRLQAEREYEHLRLDSLVDEDLWEVYLEWFLDERGADVMLAEFRLHQVLFGTRWCDATKGENGKWDHAECNGHSEHLFADKEEARTSPEELLELLYVACDAVDMSMRDAKNSDRQGSSSGSSPLPSEEGESTASTPIATPPEPLGSSSSPSATPLPSWAGAS